MTGSVERFFSTALIGIGFMMMLLCGGCGALFFFGLLFSSLLNANHLDAAMVALPLVMGGVPTAIGFGLFYAGRRLRRPGAEPRVREPWL